MTHFVNSEIGRFQVSEESQVNAFQEFTQVGNFKIQLYQRQEMVCESLFNLHSSIIRDFVFKKENLQILIFYRDQTLVVADLEICAQEKTVNLKVILKSKIDREYVLCLPTTNPQLITFSKEIKNNGPGENWRRTLLKVGEVESDQIQFREFSFETSVSFLDIQSIKKVLVLVDEESKISLMRISLA